MTKRDPPKRLPPGEFADKVYKEYLSYVKRMAARKLIAGDLDYRAVDRHIRDLKSKKKYIIMTSRRSITSLHSFHS